MASEVGGGNRPPPPFPTPKKVRGCLILNIVIVVRLAIKNLEESDCLVVVNIQKPDFLSIKIVNFSDVLPVRNARSLTFWWSSVKSQTFDILDC